MAGQQHSNGPAPDAGNLRRRATARTGTGDGNEAPRAAATDAGCLTDAADLGSDPDEPRWGGRVAMELSTRSRSPCPIRISGTGTGTDGNPPRRGDGGLSSSVAPRDAGAGAAPAVFGRQR